MKLSVISPAYNEEEVLPYYFDQVEKVCNRLMTEGIISDYEIIIIDDGSTDDTWNIIHTSNKKNGHIRGIKLSRNFGHHNAISAGLMQSEGDFTILMDADLQANPDHIPDFINAFRNGSDMVWGIAKQRKGDFLVTLGSQIYYWFFNKISGIKIPKNAIMIAASRRALDQILKLKEVRQFTIAQWMYVGFKTSYIPMERRSRLKGSAKYTFLNRIRLALISIVGFSKVPLKISSWLGFMMFLVGTSSGIYIIIRKVFYGISVSGYASLFSAMTMLFGVQFFILGIIGEYMGIVIDEVKSRPRFVIEETL